MGCGSTHHAKLLPPLDHTAACAKVASCRQGRLSTAQPLQAACAYLVDLAQPGVDGREDVLWGAHAHEHVVMAVAIVTPLLFRDISKMRQAGVHAEQQATLQKIGNVELSNPTTATQGADIGMHEPTLGCCRWAAQHTAWLNKRIAQHEPNMGG